MGASGSSILQIRICSKFEIVGSLECSHFEGFRDFLEGLEVEVFDMRKVRGLRNAQSVELFEI